MYGLVKIAEEQTINLNSRSREDRLLDELEDAREHYEALDAQRNPELAERGDAAFWRHTLTGSGIGAGIGGLAGAIGGFRSGGLRDAGLAGLGLGAAGALYGAIPGAISGAVKQQSIVDGEEDPELIRRLEEAWTERESAEEKLERHYLSGDRYRRREEERLKALGY